MKKTMKWFGLVFCLGLMMMAMTLAASAETAAYDLWVGGEQFTSDKLTVNGGSGSATYDPAENTLTLNNYSYTGEGSPTAGSGQMQANFYAALYYGGTDELKVVLTGTNAITRTTNGSSYGYGIYSCGPLTFSGTGTLTVNGGEGISHSTGIYVKNGLTVQSGTVNASGGTARDNSIGVWSEGGNVTVTGGLLDARGGAATNSRAFSFATGNTLSIDPSEGLLAEAKYGSDVDSLNRVVSTEKIDVTDYLHPVVQLTAREIPLWVGGQQITADQLTVSGGDGGTATYDPAENTLTLNNYSSIGEGHNNAAIYYGGTDTLNVVLMGESTVQGPDRESGVSYGIYAGGSLSFSGSGTLTAIGGTATGESGESYGVFTYGSVTVSENGTLTATGGEASYSYGVYASDAITVSGGSLTAPGGTATGESGESYGVYAFSSSVTISGGTMTATGGTAAKRSCGVDASSSSVTIFGGTLTATGGEATDSYGVFVNGGSVEVSGGSLETTGGAATNYSYGVVAYGFVTISGGTMTAISGEANYSCGVFADIDVIVSGGKLTAKGGTATTSYGVYASDAITVSGGKVIAMGGTEAFSVTPVLSNYNDARLWCGVNANAAAENGPHSDMEYYTNTRAQYARIAPESSKYFVPDLWVGGVELNELNPTVTDENGGTATFDPDTNTLTLDGYSSIGEGHNNAAIYYGGTDLLGIELVGTSTVQGPVHEGGFSYGIFADADNGSLHFFGTGTLTVTGGESATRAGVYVRVGSVTVSGGTLKAVGGTAVNDSCGVLAHVSVIVTGGSLEADGGTATSGSSHGVYTDGSVTVSGGILKAVGGTAVNDSYGVRANTGSVTVSGGELTAIGGEAGSSYGMYLVTGSVTVSGGTLNATGGTATDGAFTNSYGVHVHTGSVTVSENGTLNATGGKSIGGEVCFSYGVYIDEGSVMASGGSLTAIGGEAGSSYGMYLVTGSVTVSGGTLNTTGGTAVTDSWGVYADTGVAVEDGTLNATGGTATGGTTANSQSIGVFSAGNVTVSDGSLTAVGGKAAYSYGVYLLNQCSIEVKGNGKLEASGGTDSDYSMGVKLEEGSVTVSESGSLIATGGDAVKESFGAVVRGDLTLTGGTITAKGGDASAGLSQGMSIGENLTVSGNGTMTAEGGVALAGMSQGVSIWGDLTVSDNATLTAIGGMSMDRSYGVNVSGGSVTVSGNGTLTATGGKTTDGVVYDSYGVYIDNGSVTISGGTLTATGLEATDESVGLYVNGSVTVSGGELNVVVGNATELSYGMYATGSLTVEGGELNAVTGSAGDTSYGVCAAGDFTVTGGTLTIVGGVFPAPSLSLEGGHAVSYGASAETAVRVSFDKISNDYFNGDYLCIMPTDETFFDLLLGGNQFSSEFLTFPGKQGTATYDPAENTLTLSDYVYGGPWNVYAALHVGELTDALTVILQGENAIEYDGVTEGNAYGIYGSGDLVLAGEGSLSVTGDLVCLYVNGTLEIGNGVHLVANASMDPDIASIYAIEVRFTEAGFMRNNWDRFEAELDGWNGHRFEAVGKDHYTITAGDESHTLTCACSDTSDIHLNWDYVHIWTYTRDPEADHILHGECGFCGDTAKIVLVAPENPVYNGADWEVTVEIDHPSITLHDNALCYEPYRAHNVGEYTAVVTLTNADGSDVTVSVAFTVAKADPIMTEAPTLIVPEHVGNLASISFSGGVVKDVLGNELPGVWVWEDGTITPENGKSYWAEYGYSSPNYNRLKVQFEVIFNEDPEPDPNPGVGTEPDPDPGVGTDPDPGVGTDPDPGVGTNPNPGVGTEPDSGVGTEPDPGEGTEPDPEVGTEPDSGVGTEPDPGEETEPDPGEGTEPDSGEGTEPDPGEGTDPDPGVGTEPGVEQGGCRSSGCSSAFGSGVVTLVGLVALAGLAIRKRED